MKSSSLAYNQLETQDKRPLGRDPNRSWCHLHTSEDLFLVAAHGSMDIGGSIRWTGHVARMYKDRSAFKILTVKPTGNIPLGRPKRRYEDNIRIDLKETGFNTSNGVVSAQDRDYWRALVNAALNSGFITHEFS